MTKSNTDPPNKFCQYFLQKKGRRCKFIAKSGQLYCGNHLYLATSEGPRRVPCPVDPRQYDRLLSVPSQPFTLLPPVILPRLLWLTPPTWVCLCCSTVLENELPAHIKKCPKLKELLSEKDLPFLCTDVNAGSEEEPDMLEPGELMDADAATDGESPLSCPLHMPANPLPTIVGQGPFAKGKALQRAAYAKSLGSKGLSRVVEKIHAAHASMQNLLADRGPVSIPEVCLTRPQEDPHRSYNEKHVVQQAAMVGVMEAHGLLQDASSTSYVELGAGKGYLSVSLSDACQPGAVVLVDYRRSFKIKGDRCLRHLRLHRVRADLKDLKIEQLPGGDCAIVASGKHLCGAATDYALRACLRLKCRNLGTVDAQQGAPDPEGPSRARQNVGVDLDETPGSHQRQGGGGEFSGSLRGLVVAPCCHHRCGWKAYVGKNTFRELSFSPREFELVSWMTGWALCGHGSGPGGGDEEEDEDDDVNDNDRGGDMEAKEDQTEPEERLKSSGEVDNEGRLEGPEGQNDDGQGDEGAGAPMVNCGEGEPGCQPASSIEDFEPSRMLPREEKMRLGMMCKELIDVGRLRWLREHFTTGKYLEYIGSDITGENKLLVAVP